MNGALSCKDMETEAAQIISQPAACRGILFKTRKTKQTNPIVIDLTAYMMCSTNSKAGNTPPPHLQVSQRILAVGVREGSNKVNVEQIVESLTSRC